MRSASTTHRALCSTLPDQVYQEADSGNLNTFGVFSYIVACSLTTPFVPNLNLNQPMNQSGGFDPGSNTSFNYTPQNGTPAGITTIFFGSIDTLSVDRAVAWHTIANVGGLWILIDGRVTTQAA